MALTPINLSNLLTFNTDTHATRTNAAGLIEPAVVNQPRFDFHPTTGQFLGILCEEARDNWALWTESFDNAVWGKTGLTVSANAEISPTGALTADRLVEDTGTSQRRISDTLTVPSGTKFVWSIFVKPDENRKGVTLHLSSTSGFLTVDFNLLNGTKSSAVGSGGVELGSGSIQRINGTYRLWVALETTAAVTSISVNCYFSNDPTNGNATYTGDGVSGISVWGADLSPGSFLTSYIPNNGGTSTTRSADIATATVTSLLNPTEGTLVVEYYKTSLNAETERFACLDDGTNSNRVHIISTSANNLQVLITSGGATQAAPTIAAPAAPGTVKVAAAYKLDDFVLAVNGAVVATDVSGAVPVGMTTLRVGCGTSSNEQPNDRIKSVTYYATRLTNTELEQITTL